MPTLAALKNVSGGIQAVASRLKKAGDGLPACLFLRDSLVEIDAELVSAKKPTCTEDEFDGYVWDTTGGQKRGEQPVKKNDHGMDVTRYGVAYFDLAPSPNTITRTTDPAQRRRYGYA